MVVWDLYGFLLNDLVGIATRAGSILGVNFVLHESSSRGGDYYRYGRSWEEAEFILQRNAELDDELAEPEFPEYPLLLYIFIKNNCPKQLDEIRSKLVNEMKETIILLKHNV